MKPTTKRNRPKPYDEMSTTQALSGPNPVERSYRPIARPDRPRMMPDEEMSTTRALSSAPSNERLSFGSDFSPSSRFTAEDERKRVGNMRQNLIDYVDDLKRGPPSMGERMRNAETRQQKPAKKFADGGMVRGCKTGQSSGTKFSGSF